MKLAMKLRTRLFLSISALITVALLGLMLGLVSVMQMAGTQEALIRNNFVTLDLGLKLRQTLGDQLIMMLAEKPDPVAFEASKQRYFELLDEGIAQEQKNDNRQYGFSQAKSDYLTFLEAFDISRDPNPHVAFGSGVHHCLGATLVRVEGQEVFKALAERFPSLHLETEHLEYQPSITFRSLKSLPVTWQ